MKPLDCLKKRDLLAAQKFDADLMREYAHDFFQQERYGDAFEFYRKLEDEAGIRRVKERAIQLGDPELLWRIEHADRNAVTRDDWTTCGDNAIKLGKFRSAAYAFRHIGDEEKAAAAENAFKPAEEGPPPAG